jgi:hypothetical protein
LRTSSIYVFSGYCWTKTQEDLALEVVEGIRELIRKFLSGSHRIFFKTWFAYCFGGFAGYLLVLFFSFY